MAGYDTENPVVQRLTALSERIEQLGQQMSAASQGDAENVEAVEQQTAALLAGLADVRNAVSGSDPLVSLLDGVEGLLTSLASKTDAGTAAAVANGGKLDTLAAKLDTLNGLLNPTPWQSRNGGSAIVNTSLTSLQSATPNKRAYLNGLQLKNLAAVATNVEILDKDTTVADYDLAAGERLSIQPRIFSGVGNALNIRLNAIVALGVKFNAQGHIAP